MCLPIAPIASVFDDLPASADMSIPSMSWAPTMVATASRMAQVVTNDAAFVFGFIALLRGWVGVPIISISKLVREKHTNSERSPPCDPSLLADAGRSPTCTKVALPPGDGEASAPQAPLAISTRLNLQEPALPFAHQYHW